MNYLFNPGPVNLSKRVRNALLRPDLCHREPEYLELLQEIQQRLLQAYSLEPHRWQVAVLSGSGTAAVEAMLVGLVPEKGRVLVICNGVYGERMRDILHSHNLPYALLEFNWEEAIQPEVLEKAFKRHKDLSHVAVVQHETSTGRLNDLAAVGALCRERGLPLLVDAVSAFGAEQLRAEDWGVAACAFSSGKCLHGIPGLGMVLLSQEASNGLQKNRNYYLNLQRCLSSPNSPLFTPALHCHYALQEALAESAEQGGPAVRRRLYLHRRRLLHEGLEAAGLRPLVPTPQAASSTSAFPLRGMSYEALHAKLKKQGLIIYAAQGRLAGRLFRLSVMGEIPDAVFRRLARRIGELYAR